MRALRAWKQDGKAEFKRPWGGKATEVAWECRDQEGHKSREGAKSVETGGRTASLSALKALK